MPVQRWRLTFSRAPIDHELNQREQLAAWDAMVEAAGLRKPDGAEQPKLALALPGLARLIADRELADLLLPERRTASDVRGRIGAYMPSGTALVDLHDVWLGEPALPG